MTYRSRLRFSCTTPGGSGAANLNAFNYVDVADPLFETKWGYGNLANNRVDIRVDGNDAGQINGTPFKRILVDGTTAALGTNAPHYQNVASVAAARTAFAPGDWILMPGGSSQTAVWGEIASGSTPHNGLSAQNLAVLGTFDPADKYNDAKINTLRYKIDVSGVGFGSTNAMYCFRALQYFCMVNFDFVAAASDALTQVNFICEGGKFILFENCTFDGVNPSIQGSNPADGTRGWTAIPITSLTNPGSGTTARAFTANTTELHIGDSIGILGASPATYASMHTITDVVAGVSFDYTFAGNGGTAATGTITYQKPFVDVPDSRCVTDVTLRFCGVMYTNDNSNGRAGAIFSEGARRRRLEACVEFHGGWGRGMTRTTPAFEDTSGNSIQSTSLTSVGTTATFNCTDTRQLATGDEIDITDATPSAYNGHYTITALVANTSFSYVFAGGVGAATVQGHYGKYVGPAAGPDQFKHGIYFANNGDDSFVGDFMSGWDASNLKLTGGNIRLQNLVILSSPIAYISEPAGNQLYSWPVGSTTKDDNTLCIGGDDIRYQCSATFGKRGQGPYQAGPISGSYIKNALLLRQSNRSTTNRLGITVNANNHRYEYTTVGLIDGMVSTWNTQNGSATPDAYTTLTIQNCVWPLATSGSNTALTDMSGAYQAKVAAAEALNATSMIAAFPTYLGSVTIVPGDDYETERNMFEYMCANPMPPAGINSWATLAQYHFRSVLA